MFLLLAASILLAPLITSPALDDDLDGWASHTIDASSRGADGVRFGVLENDSGPPAVVTGWEEGGVVRVCIKPGPDRVREPWPGVTVGAVPDVEDAVLFDLDGDGFCEVISCAEGRTRSVFVHWNPGDPEAQLDPDAWRTAPIPATVGVQMWMWCVPLQVDGRNGIDLILGGKGDGASIGWLEAPEDPRDLDDWRWHPIRPVGWTMSILPVFRTETGRYELLCSDRKGPNRGIFWLECQGSGPDLTWTERPVGGSGHEVMFLDLGFIDGDGRETILAATRDSGVLILRQTPDGWSEQAVSLGAVVGTGKAVRALDMDDDGLVALVVSTENAEGKHGVVLLSRQREASDEPWTMRTISGPRDGSKFDLVALLDIDGDGDHDVVTCEERDNLGVFWYENSIRPPIPLPEASNRLDAPGGVQESARGLIME